MSDIIKLAEQACKLLELEASCDAEKDLIRFRLYWLVLDAFDLGQASYKKMCRDFYGKYGFLMGGVE